MRVFKNVVCALTFALVAACTTNPADEVGTVDPPTSSKIGGPGGGACFHTGCSGQVCASEVVYTTCEWRDEYACYQGAACERQPDGQCGFTPTPELAACLADAGPGGPGV